MARRLTATVYLHDEDGVVRSFGPGDTVPDWVAAQILNPDLLVDEPAPDPESAGTDDNGASAGDSPVGNGTFDPGPPPPKYGKGSSLAAWLQYADEIGVEVPEDAGRDAVIAAVEAAEK